MANKINVKLILELREAQMSQRKICRTLHISQHSVGDVFKITHEKGICFEDIKGKSEEEIYQMFFPDKFSTENLFKQPNYEKIHTELKKTGVTLKLLCRSTMTAVFQTSLLLWDIPNFAKGIPNMSSPTALPIFYSQYRSGSWCEQLGGSYSPLSDPILESCMTHTKSLSKALIQQRTYQCVRYMDWISP